MIKCRFILNLLSLFHSDQNLIKLWWISCLHYTKQAAQACSTRLEALQRHLPETINYLLLDMDCTHVYIYIYVYTYVYLIFNFVSTCLIYSRYMHESQSAILY